MAYYKNLGLANNEIVSFTKNGNGAPGTIDHYTFTRRDGSVFAFDVTNGANGGPLTISQFTSWTNLKNYVITNKLMIASILFVGNGSDEVEQISFSIMDNVPFFYEIRTGDEVTETIWNDMYDYACVFVYAESEELVFDSDLSTTSENAVQNKAITSTLNNIQQQIAYLHGYTFIGTTSTLIILANNDEALITANGLIVNDGIATLNDSSAIENNGIITIAY